MLIDSGNLAGTSSNLGLIASILSGLNYDAVGIGANDLRVGDEFFRQISEKKLPILDASPDANKVTQPYIIKTVEGVKVGIVSFGATKGTSDDFTVRKGLYSAYKAARDASDILIVMDQGNVVNRDWIERNSERFGAPDLVVGGVSRMGMMTPEIVGKTYICPTSYQGKHIGVADIELVPGEDRKVTVQKITLDTTIPEDPEIAKLVVAGRQTNVAQAVVQGVNPQIIPAVSESGNTTPASRKPYYPVQLCKTCHLKEYENWIQSGHAKAIKTLVDAKQTSPECLTCHSEMFRRLGQWAIASDNIGGVECATCHADSLPHGLERRNVKQRTKVDVKLCVTCHIKERSPDYNEKTYFPKTVHNVNSENLNNTGSLGN